jgi:ferritin-like metal-binding protein YciE
MDVLNIKTYNMDTNNTPVLHSKLEEFFQIALKELYWSEQNLVNVLGTMANVASHAELKRVFDEHREQSMIHVQRLESVFEQLALVPNAKHCIGLQGLFDEGWHIIDQTDEGSAQRDVALIIAAQKVEHYEIACYGSFITLANTLKREDVAQLLIPTLNEEKQTDLMLTQIAESGINEQASQEEPESPAVDNTTAGLSMTDIMDREAYANSPSLTPVEMEPIQPS